MFRVYNIDTSYLSRKVNLVDIAGGDNKKNQIEFMKLILFILQEKSTLLFRGWRRKKIINETHKKKRKKGEISDLPLSVSIKKYLCKINTWQPVGLIVYWLVEASLFKCRLLINYITIICYVIGYITIGCCWLCCHGEATHNSYTSAQWSWTTGYWSTSWC